MSARARNSPGTLREGLLRFLQSPASYPHQPQTVRAVETHISWVFIASPLVFKMKKPVNLGFADFSTLQKRRHYCQRELELNRRLCPDVYLAVLPIFEGDGCFSFADEGAIVEYALKMRDLPQGWFLGELLEKGAVGETEIGRIVARLHEFYSAENATAEIEEWGQPEKLKISTDENFTQVEPFIGQTLSRLAFDTIRHFTNQFYSAQDALFRERLAQRRILDCHGDLRLDHVHITPDAVTIFDCIEFNDRFRFIDLANDVAFLAMDFDFAARHDLSNLLLRKAARQFSDPGILKLGTFYKCYRAVVRGKVESIQAISQHVVNAEAHAARAARYFRLALQYAVGGSERFGAVVMGRIGTGKSSVAQRLAQEADWPVFSSDEIRKTLAGIPLRQRTPPELRPGLYSEEMTQRTYQQLAQDALAAVEERGAAIMDATFSREEHRELVRRGCRDAGVRVQFIELTASDEEIMQRLEEREQRAGEVSDARLEDFAKLAAAYEPPTEGPDVIRVPSASDIETTTRATMLRLAENQAQRS